LVAPAYAADGGVPTRFVPIRNAAESPYRYMIAPEDLLQVVEIEDGGEFVWGIVHSQRRLAGRTVSDGCWPGLLPGQPVPHLLADAAGPIVRAWSIQGEASTVLEVPLTVGG
jgi:hypothetical protein